MTLGVSPAATSTPRVFSIRGLRLYFPVLEPWDARSVLQPGLPPSLSVRECGATGSTLWGLLAEAWPAPFHNLPPCWVRHLRLAASPLHPGCPSLPLLPVWMNVSSLSAWLSDFHIVRFSVSSVFLFLNCCCPSFGCGRRHSVSTYTSIVAGSSFLSF